MKVEKGKGERKKEGRRRKVRREVVQEGRRREKESYGRGRREGDSEVRRRWRKVTR